MKKAFVTLLLLIIIQTIRAQIVKDSRDETVYSSGSQGALDDLGGIYIGASMDLNKASYASQGVLGLPNYGLDFGSFLSPAIFIEFEKQFKQAKGVSFCSGFNYAFSSGHGAEATVNILGQPQVITGELKQNIISTPLFLRYTFPFESGIRPYIDVGYQVDLYNQSSMTIDYPFTNTIDGVATRAGLIYSLGAKFGRFNLRFRGYLKLTNAVEPIAGVEYGHRVNSLLSLSYKVR